MALRPLVAIIGTTGTGKSKLAIEIAKHLAHSDICNGAEVINADAMQVYAGMDIITNKVTSAEMQGVPHHLMGFKQPGEQYIVGEWVRDTMALISDMHSRNKVPIVVGGTSYWMQHLIFPGNVNYEEPDDTVSPELSQSIGRLPPELLDYYNNLPNVPAVDDALIMYKLLNALDPRMGARWHWNDIRKTHRSLVIIKSSGRLATDRVVSQSQTTPEPYFQTILFWLYAKNTVIYPRLDSRVVEMMSRGLIDEVRELLHLKETSGQQDLDFTTGIYQSIGYREFYKYLKLPEPDENALDLAIDGMKTSTRQYAKRQISWIRNKLLPEAQTRNLAKQATWTYLLDVENLEEWSTNVKDPAMKIIDGFLRDSLDIDPFSLCEAATEMLVPAEQETDPLSRLDARKKIICPMCTVDKDKPVLIDEALWNAHKKARVHRRMIQRAERMVQRDQYFAVRRAQEESESQSDGAS